ncbi:hypothetical protein FUAX_28650 [Fulvitalea axinellae]|uniref:DUF4469 domain-containing protein n=1 Tax=Fulvitalea axinellae TaxID=1182444 RepID=A0AAU9D398_9BACT|nr:hypothetical protein FUAX_28650 [Fulvitalea axinellae]
MEYYLIDNKLTTDDEKDQTAKVSVGKVHDLDSVVELMISRGSTTTRTDILAVLNEYQEVLEYIVTQGEGVNLPSLNLNYSITGAFEDRNDSFDPTRHQLNLKAKPSQRLKEALKHVNLQKIKSRVTGPQIEQVENGITGQTDDTAQSGGILVLDGSLLKIDTEAPEAGLFLIASDGTEHKAVRFIENRPQRLVALLPAVPSGEYDLEVRTLPRDSKNIRSIRYNTKLSIS